MPRQLRRSPRSMSDEQFRLSPTYHNVRSFSGCGRRRDVPRGRRGELMAAALGSSSGHHLRALLRAVCWQNAP
jgi:hypothetical protein